MIKKIPVWLDGQYIAITTIYKSEDELVNWAVELGYSSSATPLEYSEEAKNFLDGFDDYTSQAFLEALKDELNSRIDKLEAARILTTIFLIHS